MARAQRGWKVWIEASGDGRWRCRWRGCYGTGQQTFIYKDDARDLERERKRDFQRRDAGLPALQAGRADYAGFKADYLRWLESRRAARTRYNAGRALDLYEQAVGPLFPSRAQIRAYGDWLMAGRYGANAARIHLRHAKAAFRWAHREGLIDYDPFAYYEFPAAAKVARLLKPEELKAIFRRLPPHVLRPVFFILYTGLRLSEVAWLDWSGIERRGASWYLTVRKSKTRRKDGEETKTQQIHHLAVSVLGAPRKSGRVFGLSKYTISEQFRRAVRKADIGRVRLHDLRHTWATYLAQSSKDLRAVMQAGGWVTMQAAMIYQHETDERRDVTGKMEYPAPFQPLLGLARKTAGERKKAESSTRN